MRSQDRKRLYKANELFIEKDIYKDWCIETEVGDDYITKDVWYICVNLARLGKYFNEERALEVLDEIQEAQLGNYHYRCPSNVKVSNNENTIVYQMPIE